MLIVSLKTVIFGLKLRLRLVQICHFAVINKRPIGLNADDFFLSLQLVETIKFCGQQKSYESRLENTISLPDFDLYQLIL